jgi:hypothetical protein
MSVTEIAREIVRLQGLDVPLQSLTVVAEYLGTEGRAEEVIGFLFELGGLGWRQDSEVLHVGRCRPRCLVCWKPVLQIVLSVNAVVSSCGPNSRQRGGSLLLRFHCSDPIRSRGGESNP